MGELGDLYAQGRGRIIELVTDADPDTRVPTCPLWSVQNVLAHVAGIPADILAGNVEGAATDPWTAAQVDARRDKTIAEIVAEWLETGPRVDDMIDSFGRTGAQLLLDLTTHEHDIRLALGRPGERDAPVLDIALDFIAGGFGTFVDQPLAVEADGRSWRFGDGTPTTTLRGSRFDVVRAFTGRRSRTQVESMDWSGDPSMFVPQLEYGPFTVPADDVPET